MRMLNCHARDGRSFTDYVYRRIVDGSRTSGRVGGSTP